MQIFDIFYSYLNLGFHHIVDINGYDHLLFIITLCAIYEITEWRKVVVVITAFTLGHSVTLVLASLKIIFPNRHLIELLIPVTILISGVFNLFSLNGKLKRSKLMAKYLMALFFGLIHGMSFSSFFTDLMGDASSIILPLFSFNVGIEVGQLMVIFIFYLIVYLFYRFAKVSYKTIAVFFSVLGILVSTMLIFYRF